MSNLVVREKTFQVLNSEKMQEQLKMALPKIMPLDKFTRSIVTQLNKIPKLLECSQESLFASIISLAGAGLEADGYNAHILPYKGVATPIIDYKGMIELMYRSGQVSAVNGYAVHENDDFEFDMGEVTKHKINYKQDRGDFIGAFTIVRMKDGAKSFYFMPKSDIDKIGKTSPSWGGRYSPWTKHYQSMAIKTVLRQHSKWVPLSSEAKDIIMKEIEAEVLSDNRPSLTMKDLVNITPEPETIEMAPVESGAKDAPKVEAAETTKVNPDTGEIIEIDAAGFPEPEGQSK